MNSQSNLRQRGVKLAVHIAGRIAQELTSRKLAPGTPLGDEASLAQCFSTSRWTMREAISILHRDQLVEVRRGRRGGIFAATGESASLTGTIRAYFEFLDVSVDEILEARRALNYLVLELALRRVSSESAEAMRKSSTPHLAVLSACRSPAVQLLAQSARRLEVVSLLRSPLSWQEYRERMNSISSLRRSQIDAIISDDIRTSIDIEDEIIYHSRWLLERSFEIAEDDSRERRRERVDIFIGHREPVKKPVLLMMELAADVIARGWSVGAHLGSEAELLAEYGVGRSVFREAIRPLEGSMVLEMRTGRQSGLKIATPDLGHVITTSLLQFSRIDSDMKSFVEALAALAAAAAGLAADRALAGGESDSNADNLLSASAEEFLEVLGQVAENRVITTMMNILLAKLTSPNGEAGHAIWRCIERGRASLSVAIRDGDRPLARRLASELVRGFTEIPAS